MSLVDDLKRKLNDLKRAAKTKLDERRSGGTSSRGRHADYCDTCAGPCTGNHRR